MSLWTSQVCYDWPGMSLIRDWLVCSFWVSQMFSLKSLVFLAPWTILFFLTWNFRTTILKYLQIHIEKFQHHHEWTSWYMFLYTCLGFANSDFIPQYCSPVPHTRRHGHVCRMLIQVHNLSIIMRPTQTKLVSLMFDLWDGSFIMPKCVWWLSCQTGSDCIFQQWSDQKI